LYYKIFNNLTPWSPSEYFNVSMPPYSLHYVNHDFNIRKAMCQTNSFENDFFNRCVSAWNSSPSSLVKSKSIASFKYNLKSIDLSSFLNYVFYNLNLFCLLCTLICYYGVTLTVLFVYPVTTKDTCIFILSLF